MRPILTLAVLYNDPPFAQSRDAGGSREHRPSSERLSSSAASIPVAPLG